MASNQPVSSSSDDQAETLSDNVRSVVTLLLILHLFCVFVALSSTLFGSPLQRRLLGVLRPYNRLLNLEPTYAQFYLTYASEIDVDHRIEILPEGLDAESAENWHVIPDVGMRCGDRYKRYQRLGRQMAVYAEQDTVVSKIAQSAAVNYLKQGGSKPQQIRLRRHTLQAWNVFTEGTAEQRDANDAQYFRDGYVANTLVDDAGNVDLVKIDSASEVARPDAGEE